MGTTRILLGSFLEKVYTLFAVEDDASLIFKMSILFTLFLIIDSISSFRNPAPYGKHSTHGGSIVKLHPKIAWAIMEAPSWILPTIILYNSNWKETYLKQPQNFCLTLAFVVHYVHRSLVYPFGISARAKPVPLNIFIGAFIFCSFNGIHQSVSLLNAQFVNLSLYLLGMVVFIAGIAINVSHDWNLLSLRTRAPEYSKEKLDYGIPRGLLFEFISGANYTGEILEWWGLAIASGYGIPQMQFAVHSTLYLGSRALYHHKYYKQTFSKLYPESRKAILPFIL